MYKILANTLFLGKDIVYLTDCHSTNDEANNRLVHRTVSEGSIIITDNQTKGRGQRGNQWISEPGKNLTFTLILQPSFLIPSDQFYLNMSISLAVTDFFDDYVQGVKIKWPNDIFHTDSGKLGGVLIENSISSFSIESSIVGIGLNINQVDFTVPNATSLTKLTNQNFDLWELFRLLVMHIEKRYLELKKGMHSKILSDYLNKLFRYEEWAKYEDNAVFIGRIRGIGKDGKLIIEKENGFVNHYAFKEVKFLFDK
jgi:BirA family transcriptional regulator, biotin operon repressor / biotin---[acetyl-CoA-carboxylase] ligase